MFSFCIFVYSKGAAVGRIQIMFLDKVDIYIKAGNGGNGCVSFHREKYVAKGGPDGGDGGKGGDIIFLVDEGLNTLLPFKHHRKFIAQNGGNGMNNKFHGKNGENTILRVPLGTVIKDKATGRIIKDMSAKEPFVALKGGRGGWGNTHFATATRQVPHFAKGGIIGNELEVTLELKMLADVGLVGFPNVGKSSLLAYISSARPKIANYHFTTLSPNLGVVSVYDDTFVVADIPGLIEGASEGLGLGHSFLRHIDRCRLIIHVVDISGSENRDPIDDIDIINNELFSYHDKLANRPQIIAATKIDLGYDDSTIDKIRELGYEVFPICPVTGEGVDALLKYTASALKEAPPLTLYESEEVEEIVEDDRITEIRRENDVFFVTGKWLEKVISSINLYDRESLQYFQRVLKNSGVIELLVEKGIKEGDTVNIYDVEFDFIP